MAPRHMAAPCRLVPLLMALVAAMLLVAVEGDGTVNRGIVGRPPAPRKSDGLLRLFEFPCEKKRRHIDNNVRMALRAANSQPVSNVEVTVALLWRHFQVLAAVEYMRNELNHRCMPLYFQVLRRNYRKYLALYTALQSALATRLSPQQMNMLYKYSTSSAANAVARPREFPHINAMCSGTCPEPEDDYDYGYYGDDDDTVLKGGTNRRDVEITADNPAEARNPDDNAADNTADNTVKNTVENSHDNTVKKNTADKTVAVRVDGDGVLRVPHSNEKRFLNVLVHKLGLPAGPVNDFLANRRKAKQEEALHAHPHHQRTSVQPTCSGFGVTCHCAQEVDREAGLEGDETQGRSDDAGKRWWWQRWWHGVRKWWRSVRGRHCSVDAECCGTDVCETIYDKGRVQAGCGSYDVDSRDCCQCEGRGRLCAQRCDQRAQQRCVPWCRPSSRCTRQNSNGEANRH